MGSTFIFQTSSRAHMYSEDAWNPLTAMYMSTIYIHTIVSYHITSLWNPSATYMSRFEHTSSSKSCLVGKGHLLKGLVHLALLHSVIQTLPEILRVRHSNHLPLLASCSRSLRVPPRLAAGLACHPKAPGVRTCRRHVTSGLDIKVRTMGTGSAIPWLKRPKTGAEMPLSVSTLPGRR